MARLTLVLALALALLVCAAARPLAGGGAAVRQDADEVDHSQHSDEEHAAHEAAEKAEASDEVDHSQHSDEEHAAHEAAEKAEASDEVDHEGHDHSGETAEEHAAHADEENEAEEEEVKNEDADEAEAEDDDGTCFPADATVTLASGAVKRMDALAVGDVVHVGAGVYSPVFMFTHKTADHAGAFVRLTTASGAALTATAGHFVHADGALVAAGRVPVGAALARASDGAPDRVVRVDTVHASGLYNPQTLHGDVAVDGLVASTYTRAVAPPVAHAVLAPARALYAAFGWYSAALEGGSRLAGAVPAGHAVL